MDDKPVEQEVKDIKLTITLKVGEKIPVVEGPILNEPLCLYMLEYGKLAII